MNLSRTRRYKKLVNHGSQSYRVGIVGQSDAPRHALDDVSLVKGERARTYHQTRQRWSGLSMACGRGGECGDLRARPSEL